MWILKFISILFLLVSCNQKDNSNRNTYSQKDSTIKLGKRTINNFDTTNYKKVKDGFYTNASGDIYELKVTLGEDSLGFYSKYFLDSLMLYGDYPNKKPLEDIIDLNTFENDSLSNFSKDRKHVYEHYQLKNHIKINCYEKGTFYRWNSYSIYDWQSPN